jgi:hypothetical protein
MNSYFFHQQEATKDGRTTERQEFAVTAIEEMKVS